MIISRKHKNIYENFRLVFEKVRSNDPAGPDNFFAFRGPNQQRKTKGSKYKRKFGTSLVLLGVEFFFALAKLQMMVQKLH